MASAKGPQKKGLQTEVPRLEMQEWMSAWPARRLEPSTALPDTCKYISHAPSLVWGRQLCGAVSVISYESESRSVMSNSLWPCGLYSPWNSPGQNTGVGSHSLQGVFLTQRSNPGLLHCRWILYQLSHKGSPRMLEWVAVPFSNGSSRPRNRTGALHCRQILYQLSYQGSPMVRAK